MQSKDQPYNNLPHLPVVIDYDDVEILKAVNRANIALSELKGAAFLLPDQKLLVAPLTVREAVASNGIENVHTTVTDVLQAEVLADSEIRLPEKETLNYRKALTEGLKAVVERQALTSEDILAIQALLEPEKAGIRQRVEGRITRIRNRTTGEIIYTPPDDPALLEELLRNFESYYNDTDDSVDATIKAAILHYQFEAIHPFEDGNGRAGRILMVLYFVLRNRLSIPLLFISGYLLKNRSDYYKLLVGVTERAEWKPWILFILKGIEEQAAFTKNTVIAVKELIAEYKATAVTQNLPADSSFVDHLFSQAFYTITGLAQVLGVHRNTATRYLKQLEAAQVLKSMTIRKELVFFYPKFLDILSR